MGEVVSVSSFFLLNFYFLSIFCNIKNLSSVSMCSDMFAIPSPNES